MIHEPEKIVRTAVFLSGGGRTLENLIRGTRDETRFPARIELVISTNPESHGLAIATAAGIPTRVIVKKGKTVEQFSDEISSELDAVRPDLICLAGFLCFYQIPDRYQGKIINIHPALLPAFGGKGMYGHFVHEAVLEHGCKVSGCTVHFADNVYDHGPIIVQRTVPVLETDTPDTLAARVFEQEKIAYPEAVRLFAQGRLVLEGKRCRILPEK